MDIKAIKKRCEEIKHLQAREEVEHRLRCGKSMPRENKANLIRAPEPTRDQQIIFVHAMPTAILRKYFPNGVPHIDVSIKKGDNYDHKTRRYPQPAFVIKTPRHAKKV